MTMTMMIMMMYIIILLLLIEIVNSYYHYHQIIKYNNKNNIRLYNKATNDVEILPLLETAPWISTVDDILPAPYNNLIDINVVKQTIIYEVTLGRELSIDFAQANGYVYISNVYSNSKAEGLGIKVNDVILAISATAGDKLWFHGTVEGLVSALSTRFVMSSSVTLHLERSLSSIDDESKRRLKIPLIQTVRLKRPIGIHVHEGPDKGVFIQYIKPGYGAAQSKRVEIGDQVVALSASWGDNLWDIDSVESFIVSVGMRSDSFISLKLKRMVAIDIFTGAVPSSVKSDVNNNNDGSTQKKSVSQQVSADSVIIEKIDTASSVNELMKIWIDIRNDDKNYLSFYTNFYINKLMTTSLKFNAADVAIEIFEKTYCFESNDTDIDSCPIPNSFVCTTVLKAYGIRNETKKILSILQFLDRNSKQHADGAFFSSLITELARAKQFSEVERLLFDEIPSRDISYSSILTNNLLQLYATSEKGDGTLKLYQLMKQKDISLSSSTYSALFKALLNSSKSLRDQSFAILSSLPSTVLNTDIFNHFLEAYYVTRNYGKLKIILRMMNAAKIDLDVKGYGYVINLLAETQKPRVALNVFDDLKKNGLVANKHCYMGALKAMRCLKDTGGTVQMLVEMNENKLYPELPHYTVAMFSCITGNQYSLVQTIFDTMVSKNCQPDTAIYTFLLQSLLEQGNWKEGVELFEKMKSGLDDIPIANIYTYSYMIRFCTFNDKHDYANEVLDFIMTNMNETKNLDKFDSRVLFTSLLEVIPSKKYAKQREIEFKSLRELSSTSISKESLAFLIKLCERLVYVPGYFYIQLLTFLANKEQNNSLNKLLQARLTGKIVVVNLNEEIMSKERSAMSVIQKNGTKV